MKQNESEATCASVPVVISTKTYNTTCMWITVNSARAPAV